MQPSVGRASFFAAVKCRCGSASDTKRPMFCSLATARVSRTCSSELKISGREPRDMEKVLTGKALVAEFKDEFSNLAYARYKCLFIYLFSRKRVNNNAGLIKQCNHCERYNIQRFILEIF